MDDWDDQDDGLILLGTDNFMHKPAWSTSGNVFDARGGGRQKTLPAALRAGLCMKSSVLRGVRPSSPSSLLSLQSSHVLSRPSAWRPPREPHPGHEMAQRRVPQQRFLRRQRRRVEAAAERAGGRACQASGLEIGGLRGRVFRRARGDVQIF